MAFNKMERSAAACVPLSKIASATALVPCCDLVTFAFERLEAMNPKQVIYADASNPDLCVLAEDVRPKVERLAAGLTAQGLQRGDCVCIHSFNSVLYPLLWLAIIAAGGIVTGSNPAYTSTELTHHFKTTNTKYVIVQVDHVEVVRYAASESGVWSDNVFVVGNDHVAIDTNLATLNVTWNSKKSQVRPTFNDEHTQGQTVAVLAATSGTTGLPKAAELPHKYFVSQVSIIERLFSKRTEEIRQLVCLPVFHAFAAPLAIVLPPRLGITTYFMPRFNVEPYLSHVLRLQITDIAVVPPIISALNSAPPSMLQSLRYVLCAGAPMTASVQTKLYCNLNPHATIAQVWGTTETGWITAFDPSERDFTSSVGRVLPNTVLKLVDDRGRLITSDNVPGEALIKPAGPMLCYRNNVSANLNLFGADGYYRTGDRVYLQNGKVYINGRIKDVMKVNGWQVSPEEIEQVVLELKEVKDCAVVGCTVTNTKTDLEETKPRAYVVRHSGAELRAKTVREHVARELVGYKRLAGGVVFIDKIPRNSTGKVLRRKLLELQGESDECAEQHCELESAMLTKYLIAGLVIPLCFALGPPGLVMLGFVVRDIILENRSHV